MKWWGKFFPGFAGVSAELDQAYVVCCNGNPAGKRDPHPYIFGEGIRYTYGVPDEDGICQGEWNIRQENRDRSVTDSCFVVKSYAFRGRVFGILVV